MNHKLNRGKSSIIIVVILLFFILLRGGFALPVGADVTYISNSTISSNPDNRTDQPGTITVIILDAFQQDYQWKAYVGNVTGKLTLDDSDGYTIYDWTLSTISGEVYASRSNSVSWANIECADSTVIANEESALGITSTDPDSISNTFTGSSGNIIVGTKTVSGCPSIHTYNVSEQPSDDYEEALLRDDSGVLVYYTEISDNAEGYNGQNYDFQMIVAENESSTGNTYYFWVELG